MKGGVLLKQIHPRLLTGSDPATSLNYYVMPTSRLPFLRWAATRLMSAGIVTQPGVLGSSIPGLIHYPGKGNDRVLNLGGRGLGVG